MWPILRLSTICKTNFQSIQIPHFTRPSQAPVWFIRDDRSFVWSGGNGRGSQISLSFLNGILRLRPAAHSPIVIPRVLSCRAPARHLLRSDRTNTESFSSAFPARLPLRLNRTYYKDRSTSITRDDIIKCGQY